MSNLTTLTTSLAGIEKQLQKITDDNRWSNADARNLAARTKDLIVGRTYYLLTETSLAVADRALGPSDDFNVIHGALKNMLGRGPSEKKQFLQDFRDEAAALTKGDTKALLQRLKSVEKQILGLMKM